MLKRIFSYLTILSISILMFSACGEEEIEPQQSAPQPELRSPVEDETTEDTTMQNVSEGESAEKDSEKMMNEATKDSEKSNNDMMTGEIPDTYVVKDGDTLASIAEDYYGDSKMWFEIFAQNENDINNWNQIYVGQKLKMPTKRDAMDM